MFTSSGRRLASASAGTVIEFAISGIINPISFRRTQNSLQYHAVDSTFFTIESQTTNLFVTNNVASELSDLEVSVVPTAFAKNEATDYIVTIAPAHYE